MSLYFVHPTLHATLQLLCCPWITPSTLSLTWQFPTLSSIVQSHPLITRSRELVSVHSQGPNPDQMERTDGQ